MKAGDKIKFDVEKTKAHKKQYLEMWHIHDEIDEGIVGELQEIIDNPDRQYTIQDVLIDAKNETYILCKEFDFFIPSHLIL